MVLEQVKDNFLFMILHNHLVEVLTVVVDGKILKIIFVPL